MTTKPATGQSAVRLSFMLERHGEVGEDEFSAALGSLAAVLPSVVGDAAAVRIGLRDPRDPLADVSEGAIESRIPPVLGAIEVTAPRTEVDGMEALAGTIGGHLVGLVDRERSAVSLGEVHAIIESRSGASFLSFAFQRYPGTSVEEFRHWWLRQHAAVAVRLLSPWLLAYDQVHVDRALSERVSRSANITFHPYDAYDNLTWASVEEFLASVSRPGGRDEMYQDEVGHIDHSSYRGALMALVGGVR
jgi:EthD domain